MADRRNTALTVSSRSEGRAVIITAVGDVDLTASPILRQELKKVQAGKPFRLVVDLGGVGYMDSSGLATLVEAMQQARKTSSVVILCALTDRVRSIFEIARLDSVFTITSNLEEALAK